MRCRRRPCRIGSAETASSWCRRPGPAATIATGVIKHFTTPAAWCPATIQLQPSIRRPHSAARTSVRWPPVKRAAIRCRSATAAQATSDSATVLAVIPGLRRGRGRRRSVRTLSVLSAIPAEHAQGRGRLTQGSPSLAVLCRLRTRWPRHPKTKSCRRWSPSSTRAASKTVVAGDGARAVGGGPDRSGARRLDPVPDGVHRRQRGHRRSGR